MTMGEAKPNGALQTAEPEALDAARFEALYEEHAGAIRAYLLRMCRNPVLAEDLCQEAFLRAWKARHSFQGKSSVKTWLFAIATNAAREFFRRKKLPREGVPPEEMADAGPAPDDSAQQDEAVVLLREAMKNLPDNLREPVELVRLQEMSYAEAAEVLDLTVAAVRMRVHRAHVALADALRGKV